MLKKISPKDRKTYQVTIAAFLLICILMGLACFQYYRRLQDTVKQEGGGYMQEIATQMGTNVNKTIDENFSVLRTVSTVIKNLKITSYSQLQEVVQEQQSLWDYRKLIFIDENGIAHDESGKIVALANDTYLQDAIVGRLPSMSASQIIEGSECIVFAIPVDDMQIGDNNILAMASSYDLNTFDTILELTAFDGKGYAHIIRRDGTVVVRSSSPNALETGYNILTSLSQAQLWDSRTIEDVKAEIANGKHGQLEFTLGSAREYMTYTPLKNLQWSLLTFVPVSVVNEKSDVLLEITLLLCAFITTSFALLFAALMMVSYRSKKKLEQIAYVDPITGGNTMAMFSELAREQLTNGNNRQYAVIYSNIEKFKVLNEQFGEKACDDILRSIDFGIGNDLGEDECMGRIFADNFCILVNYSDDMEIAKRFERWQKNSNEYIAQQGALNIPFIIEFGVFVVENKTIPQAHMVDRAKLSLSEATRELHSKIRYAIYDEQVRRTLFREKQLEDMMEDSLANHEFQVYLQPKYLSSSERIGGAEALVRWCSSTEGMIYPDEFIPLFEKNGFVVQVDIFVFEQVCQTLRRWLDEGKHPVKISVNCSRMHLKNPNFLHQYVQIATKYRIPAGSIEIELTENTVFENVEYLSNVIRSIQSAGFGCSMDDFGSGYSSLNLIRDIPVDTLKLDKVFFRTAAVDLSRTESVVGSIVSMSKALHMETVAEGVEERAQVDMLKRLGCDYIQGYYFARPMPIADFERMMALDEAQGATVN